MIWPSNSSRYPGNTGSRSLASFTPARAGNPEKPLIALVIQPHVCAMHSISSTPGMSGKPGKCPSNTGLDAGTVQAVRIVRVLASTARKRSIIWKYSRRMRDYRVSVWGAPRQPHPREALRESLDVGEEERVERWRREVEEGGAADVRSSDSIGANSSLRQPAPLHAHTCAAL